MTVLLRAATPDIPDVVTPTVPTLVDISRLIMARGPSKLPLSVDRVAFKDGEAEMLAVNQKRGFGSIARASIPERNFLFLGVTVVCEGE